LAAGVLQRRRVGGHGDCGFRDYFSVGNLQIGTSRKKGEEASGGARTGDEGLGFSWGPKAPKIRREERSRTGHGWGKGAGRGHAFFVLASGRGQLRKACSGSGKVDHREGRKNGSNS
jgi:hypothetical protein